MSSETGTAVAEASAEDAPAVAELVRRLLDELTDGQAPAVERLAETARELFRARSIIGLLAS